MWAETRFKMKTNGPPYVDQFRRALAKLNNAPDSQSGLDPIHPRLFWYGHDGMPLDEVPQVTFVGGKSWIGIRAYNQTDALLLYEEFPKLIRLVNGAYNTRAHVQFLEGDYDAQSGYRNYQIRSLLPRRYFKHAEGQEIWEALKARDRAVMEPIARKAIEDGIEAQAERLDIALPYRPQVQDIEIGGLRPLKIKDRRLNWLFEGVKFKLNLDLKGPWQVGHVRSRGHGDIRRVYRGSAA